MNRYNNISGISFSFYVWKRFPFWIYFCFFLFYNNVVHKIQTILTTNKIIRNNYNKTWGYTNTIPIEVLRSSLLTNFDLNTFKALPRFPRKWFQLCHSKICKERKNVLFEGSEHSGFTGWLRNHFLKCLPWPIWIHRLLNTLPCFHSKRFQLHGSQMCKKMKIVFFKGSVVHLLLTSR